VIDRVFLHDVGARIDHNLFFLKLILLYFLVIQLADLWQIQSN
jgi:hypothetical protein